MSARTGAAPARIAAWTVAMKVLVVITTAAGHLPEPQGHLQGRGARAHPHGVADPDGPGEAGLEALEVGPPW